LGSEVTGGPLGPFLVYASSPTRHQPVTNPSPTRHQRINTSPTRHQPVTNPSPTRSQLRTCVSCGASNWEPGVEASVRAKRRRMVSSAMQAHRAKTAQRLANDETRRQCIIKFGAKSRGERQTRLGTPLDHRNAACGDLGGLLGYLRHDLHLQLRALWELVARQQRDGHELAAEQLPILGRDCGCNLLQARPI